MGISVSGALFLVDFLDKISKRVFDQNVALLQLQNLPFR